MNPGLPQNAPWVPTSQLVGPYQTIVSNPGGRARRRGGVLRGRTRPRLRAKAATPYGCPPVPPGCTASSGPPECKIYCTPPKYPRRNNPRTGTARGYVTINNPTPLAWAGMAAGAAALAGGGYYLYRRRQRTQLEEQTGVSVDADCTLFTVTDATVGPANAAAYLDTAFAALEGAHPSTLVMGAGYLESVAPQCGVSVGDAGIEGLDTREKAAMVGGLAMLFGGTLHEDGLIGDDVFKTEAEAIQAFLLEHGIDDPAMVEQVFAMPTEGTSDAGAGGGAGGPGDIGLYQELVGRAPNLGGLAWGLIGALAGVVLGGLTGVGVGLGLVVPKVRHRSIEQSDDGWFYERLVVYVPGMPMLLDQYVGVVMAFHPESPLDPEGYPENRAADGVWRGAFDDETQALQWVMEFAPEDAPDYEANPGRAANMGVVGWGLLGLGAAALGGGGYAWYRNKKLNEACMGAHEWFTPGTDLELTPETVDALLEAMGQAVEEGKQDPVEIADAAIVKVSGNPECRLPMLIWGDLLRVRVAAALVAAAAMKVAEELPEPGPAPEEVGIEVDAACSQVVIHDRDLAEVYLDAWLADNGVIEGMGWIPSPLILGAQYLEHVAPHCGVFIGGSAEIIGVDTPQKAVMVGVFALNVAIALADLGVIDQDQLADFGTEITDWAAQYGVDDLMTMADEVFVIQGADEAPGFHSAPVPPADDWGEPFQNEMVANGSVGGNDGGLWRVYKDNVGDFQNAYYFKVWRQGEYYEQGTYQTVEEAQQAALDWIAAQPKRAGISDVADNPSDFLHLLGGWGAPRRSRLRNRRGRRGRRGRGTRGRAVVARPMTPRGTICPAGEADIYKMVCDRPGVCYHIFDKCVPHKITLNNPSVAQRMLGLLTGMPMAQGLGNLASRARGRNTGRVANKSCSKSGDCPQGQQCCKQIIGGDKCCVHCDDPTCGFNITAWPGYGLGRPGRPARRTKLARRMRARGVQARGAAMRGSSSGRRPRVPQCGSFGIPCLAKTCPIGYTCVGGCCEQFPTR